MSSSPSQRYLLQLLWDTESSHFYCNAFLGWCPCYIAINMQHEVHCTLFGVLFNILTRHCMPLHTLWHVIACPLMCYCMPFNMSLHTLQCVIARPPMAFDVLLCTLMHVRLGCDTSPLTPFVHGQQCLRRLGWGWGHACWCWWGCTFWWGQGCATCWRGPRWECACVHWWGWGTCSGEGEWVHIRMRVYRYRYYILYCSLQFE